MDKQQLMAQLMGTFLGELEENLRSLNSELLLLEKNPNRSECGESLVKLFRAAHSLKGAARSVGQSEIEALCHQLEDRLADLRDDNAELSPESIAPLFEQLDSIDQAAQRLKNQGEAKADEPVVPRASTRQSPVMPVVNGAVPPASKAISQPLTPNMPPSVTAESGDFAMVRVAAHRLDALLAWSGELLVARRRIAERAEQLTRLRQTLRLYRIDARRFEEVSRRFRTNSVPAEPPAAGMGFSADLRKSLDSLLQQLDHDVEQLSTSFASSIRALDQAAAPVEADIQQMRMLPFTECCQGLDRMLRDLLRNSGKQADLLVEGEDVELDRGIIEQLRDPMRHLVRNAIGHGIETREDRARNGKPPQARIGVRAVMRGSHVEITVSDDGRGLDLEAIRAKSHLDDNADPREVAQTIFLPGVSTAGQVDEVSGRGVGLDIVKSHIEGLRGSVSVTSTPGSGTTFVLTVPLTLSIMRALLLRAGGQIFAIPNVHVRKLLRFNPAEIRRAGNREMLINDDGRTPTPVASLQAVLKLPRTGSDSEASLAVIVGMGDSNLAFIVDEFLSEQEMMVKTLGRRIRRVRLVSGATLLPSGEVALVLNVGNLVRSALGITLQNDGASTVKSTEVKRSKRLILADDSVTTLSLEKSILEGAGYDVRVAANGQAAWELLQAQGADLLVSDVEMPRMNGFELTTSVRASERFHDLPIVLVTARETDADKAKGLELGASAYLVKSAFDQDQLLKTIAQLL